MCPSTLPTPHLASPSSKIYPHTPGWDQSQMGQEMVPWSTVYHLPHTWKKRRDDSKCVKKQGRCQGAIELLQQDRPHLPAVSPRWWWPSDTLSRFGYWDSATSCWCRLLRVILGGALLKENKNTRSSQLWIFILELQTQRKGRDSHQGEQLLRISAEVTVTSENINSHRGAHSGARRRNTC